MKLLNPMRNEEEARAAGRLIDALTDLPSLSEGQREFVGPLGPVFPSRSAVSDFLAGRRSLSYERVQKLGTFFHVSPAVSYPSRGPSAFAGERGDSQPREAP